MDIFSYESARRIGDQNVLRKVDALLDWSLVLPLLKSGFNRSGLGPQGHDEIVLFKFLLIGDSIAANINSINICFHISRPPSVEICSSSNAVDYF
jgi:hypothetical protein